MSKGVCGLELQLVTASLDCGELVTRVCSSLSEWAGTHRGPHLDVQTADPEVLALRSNVLSSKHRSIRRCLIAIRLHLHATGDLDKGLAAGGISDVHECVVERSVDVAHAHHNLTILDVQTKVELRLLALLFATLGGVLAHVE